MKHEDHYQLITTYRYCIYIQPRLYLFFKLKAKDKFSQFLEYLLKKYEFTVLDTKNHNSLKKASCKFQPKTKDYKRVVIHKIMSHVWKKLKVLKSITGYSLSYLIRLFLEWEMQEQEALNQNNPNLLPLQQNNDNINLIAINNYSCCESWHRDNNEISTILNDFF